MLASLFDRQVSAAIQSTPWGDWGDGTGTQASSGTVVSTSSALQLLTVYGSSRFICDGIATLPVDTFTKTAGGESVESVPPKWITQPTTDLDRVAWTSQVLSSLLLAGNAYCYKAMRAGVLEQLIPLDPAVVTVIRSNGRKAYRVNGQEVNGFEILHIPGVMYPGADVGLSPVDAARESIGVGLAAKEFGSKFFGQGATLSGVIEAPGDLVPGQAREWAKTFVKRHGGKSKAHLPAVLSGGATWKSTGVTNEQSQFLETQGYTAAEIAGQMFLIDPSDLGIGVTGSSLTYANITERNLRRVQVTYLPWIVRLDMARSSLLPPGEFSKVNVNGLLRGDMKTRYETYKTGKEIGVLLDDEIRGWEELPPLPPAPPKPPDLAGQIEAVGQLIRAGFDPAAALSLFGLPPLAHTGYIPVTVAPPSEGDTNAVV